MRLHFVLAILTAVLLIVTLRANKKHPFTFAQVQEMAKKRAAAKYVPPPNVLPPQLKNLTPEQETGIFWKDTNRLWRKKGLPFQVDFYHVNQDVPGGPQINTVDRKGAHPLAYSPAFFNFLNLTINPPLPSTLPYGGFYLRYPINKPDSLDGFFTVESTGALAGGNYFRTFAKDQVYGLSARGVALNTEVDGKKEEFPNFCEWWLYEPAYNATQITLNALLDSPSVTGAYEFIVHPGSVTSVDVHAMLFFRQKVDRLGLAPFSSMYLFGENSKDHFGDNVHPEIHDSDGILMHTGKDEWDWHPLQQTAFRQLNSYFDENPKGFGLVQRDRDFQHYQDLTNKYNDRPSAWVTPHGNWGKGKIQLVQLNSKDFNTDNVVVFWWPDQPVQAGDRLDLSYTIDFYMNDAERPPLAYCKETLINCPAPPPPPPPPPLAAVVPTPAKPNASASPSVPAPKAPPATADAKPAAPKPNAPASAAPQPPLPPVPLPPTGTVPVQFVVDFIGNGIESIPANQPPDLNLICNPPGTYLREKKVEKNGYDNSWRVTFTIIPAKPHVPSELLCRLMHNATPLTETWTYTWHQ